MSEPRYDVSKAVEDKVEVLIALGLYKAKSETMLGCLRELRSRYPKVSHAELRKRLDEKLGDRSLSDIVIEMRKEEMH